MSDNLRIYQRCVFVLDAVVQRVPESAWDIATCNPEWTVRETLGHAIWGMNRLAADASGQPIPSRIPEAEVAGADPAATWNGARDHVLTALDRQGVLQQMRETVFGTMTIGNLVGFVGVDLTTHAWDIGQAIGIDPCIPVDLAETFTQGLLTMGDTLRVPGGLGSAVEVDSDASSVATFIGLTGRDPTVAGSGSGDQRPKSWIGHIGPIAVADLEASVEFYLAAGMHMAVDLEGAAILELRGGTHLIIAVGPNANGTAGGDAPFDLMVDDVDEAHRSLSAAGYVTTAITKNSNHRCFEVTDPSGWRINVDDSHAVGLV